MQQSTYITNQVYNDQSAQHLNLSAELAKQHEGDNVRIGDEIPQVPDARSNGYVLTLQEKAFEQEKINGIYSRRVSYKRMIPITTEEVAIIGQLINNRLTDHKIPLDHYFDHIIFANTKQQQKDAISIQALAEVLQQNPTSLPVEDAIRLARYLVEENSEDWVKFRLTNETDNLIVRSRFRYIIGSVKILTSKQESDLFNEISQAMEKCGHELYAAVLLIASQKKETVIEKEQLIQAMKYAELNLNKEQQRFYFQTLTTKSQNPNVFNVEDCTKPFMKKYSQ